MFCDVRQMHPDDVDTVFNLLTKPTATLHAHADDGEWFLEANGLLGLTWEIQSHGRGFRFKDGRYVGDGTDGAFWMSFYPNGRNGSNPLRFDIAVYPKGTLGDYFVVRPDLIKRYAELLVAHGSAGKNRVGYFIKTDPPKVDQPEARKGWLRRLFG